MDYSEAEVRAFIGPNADYYVRAWTDVDPNGGLQALRWNWPAFLFNVVWLLYRRMYKYFWMAAAALIVVGAAEGVIEAILGIPAGPQWFDIVINLAVASFFGAFGTWFYYQHATWSIGQTKAHDVSPEALTRAGGVRPMWPILIFGGAVVLGILAAILIPQVAHRL